MPGECPQMCVVSDARRDEIYYALYDGEGRRVKECQIAALETVADEIHHPIWFVSSEIERYKNDLVTLFGGMNDGERDVVKRAFNDPKSAARILLATDAAGEGLNLQRSCRLLIHWDIPWNPGKMEQRNGRLDRHGQERDVHIYHFDSTDDASMRFLGRVLKKRSQTREDRVVTDEIFAQALLSHFEHDEDVEAAEERLGRRRFDLVPPETRRDPPGDGHVRRRRARQAQGRTRTRTHHSHGFSRPDPPVRQGVPPHGRASG